MMAGPIRTELTFVRHGHAHCNAAGVMAGATCTGLTESGRLAATQLAKRLAQERPVTLLRSSSTRRAVETAEIVGHALRVPVRVDDDLRVPDPGPAEGMSWRDWRAVVANGDAAGSEPWPDYLARASRGLGRILDEHTAGGRVIVVGHAETVTAAFQFLLGIYDLGRLRMNLDYTAITTLHELPDKTSTNGGRVWDLVSHNDSAHVPAGLPRYPGHVAAVSREYH
ncbi:histidine phosphatase family protein [Krasilnikovia sp. MM14-A1259]|uniref:histidine phosphatase family protein n=1 Tax=Krasilnikovia sp. MM14-A1259 TaxID=3373539 RepID=UPI00383041BB